MIIFYFRVLRCFLIGDALLKLNRDIRHYISFIKRTYSDWVRVIFSMDNYYIATEIYEKLKKRNKGRRKTHSYLDCRINI